MSIVRTISGVQPSENGDVPINGIVVDESGELKVESGAVEVTRVETQLQEHTSNSDVHVTTEDKDSWNAKADVSYVDAKVSELISDVPEALNTLQELTDALNEADGVLDGLINNIGTKASIEDLNTHTNKVASTTQLGHVKVDGATVAINNGVISSKLPNTSQINAVNYDSILGGSRSGTAFGRNTKALGSDSHAEGNLTSAIGPSSHTEGYRTTAISDNSHAEGNSTLATNGTLYKVTSLDDSTKTITLEDITDLAVNDLVDVKITSRAPILGTKITAINGKSITLDTATEILNATYVIKRGGNTTNHAEGHNTIASGSYSHAEGRENVAIGANSHAEGRGNVAIGSSSHAEGYLTNASANNSHAEGASTTASGNASHAEGWGTIASGSRSHAEGLETLSSGEASHAEGYLTKAIGYGSHAEGYSTESSGETSHAEGRETIAIGGSSHAQGHKSKAEAYASHAEGYETVAKGYASHAEGYMTLAENLASHAEGLSTKSSGGFSHAEGSNTEASGYSSHAGGVNTRAVNYASTAIGLYSKMTPTEEGDSYVATSDAFVIGNGNNGTERSNAFRVTFDGKVMGRVSYATGADYAEYWEWEDGNINEEDRVGYFVTTDDNLIRKSKSTDKYILGVISANPSVLGDSASEGWNERYIKDDFGRIQYHYVDVEHEELNENGELTRVVKLDYRPKLNPNYDSSLVYIPRENRKEWDAVGHLGKLLVRDDGTCTVGGFCYSNDEGIATASEDGYRVLERISDNIIKIFVK